MTEWDKNLKDAEEAEEAQQKVENRKRGEHVTEHKEKKKDGIKTEMKKIKNKQREKIERTEYIIRYEKRH